MHVLATYTARAVILNILPCCNLKAGGMEQDEHDHVETFGVKSTCLAHPHNGKTNTF